MTGIPPLDVEAARSRGFSSEAEIAELWRQHTEYARAKNFAMAGGAPWRSLLDAIVRKRAQIAKKATELEVQAKLRAQVVQLERQKRAEADDAYMAQAVSLESYLDSLRYKPELTEAEDALLSAPARQAGEDVGAWMMAALANARAQRGRQGVCGCGRLVSAWVHLGQRYEAGKCSVCGKLEEQARQALGGESCGAK